MCPSILSHALWLGPVPRPLARLFARLGSGTFTGWPTRGQRRPLPQLLVARFQPSRELFGRDLAVAVGVDSLESLAEQSGHLGRLDHTVLVPIESIEESRVGRGGPLGSRRRGAVRPLWQSGGSSFGSLAGSGIRSATGSTAGSGPGTVTGSPATEEFSGFELSVAVGIEL